MSQVNKIQLEKRIKIWEALSSFYLDNELSDNDYNHISEVFKKSGLNLEQLENIDKYEVFPALYLNLMSVAGEWSGFDETWLKEKCLENFKLRNSKLFRLRVDILSFLFSWMRKSHWSSIEKKLINN